MKILHIIDSGGLYGAEVMLLNLMSEQVKLGLEPILASIGEQGISEKPLEVEARRRGFHVETFRMRPGPNIAGAFKILHYAWRSGVDLLHSHGYKGNILFGLMPKGLRRLPLVTTIHGWTWTGGLDRMALYEWLDRLSLRFIDRVVVVNNAMIDKVSLKRIHVVNNGISIDSTDSKSSTAPIDPTITDFCRNGFTIGAIGRLSPEKGFDILLEALKEVADSKPEVRLVILGEGNERGALEAQIKILGLEEQVLMPGYTANARRYLPQFRIFALSSLTEGLPIVILEAMQAGVPIVATRVGGIPGVLENGRAGILLESGSCKALSEGIFEVINNQVAAVEKVQVARQRLIDHYSSRAMAESYREIYRSVIQCSSKRCQTRQTQHS